MKASTKPSYNLQAFDMASQAIHSGIGEFACNALEKWLSEKLLFQEIFEINSSLLSGNYHSSTFDALYRHTFHEYPDPIVLREIRLLALGFAREIARRRNAGERD